MTMRRGSRPTSGTASASASFTDAIGVAPIPVACSGLARRRCRQPAPPRSGSRWTNSGQPRERRGLKHRPDGDTRRVPIHPDLVTLLRAHLDEFGTGPDGRIFVGPRGGHITDRAYLKVFHEARAAAFTAEEAASPLMEVPYALRHASVSTWLRAAEDPAQVAEWAGQRVAVLLRVYTKCIHGKEREALRRIWDATRQ
jgi:integrase